MKKFLFLFVFAATAAILLSTGCTEDPISLIDPTISFTSDDPTGTNGPYPTTDFTTESIDDIVYVAVNALAGTEDLESFTVLEDGVIVDASRLTLRDLDTGTELFANNPILTIGYESRLLWEVGIDPQDEYDVAKTYTFQVEDAGGNIATTFLNITVIDPGTPVENTLEGVLLNQAGPAGQGALDLDDGTSTGTTTGNFEIAEIRDWGIDLGLPVDQNWKRQIGPMNDAVVRYAGGLPGDFKFTDIATKEEIQGYFDAGTDLPNDTGADAKSDPVSVGDFFVVSNADGSRYYFLEVLEVNVTAADNSDNYKFNIKY